MPLSNMMSIYQLEDKIKKIADAANYLNEQMPQFKAHEQELVDKANRCDNDVVVELRNEIRALERKYHELRLGGLTPEEIEYINEHNNTFKIEVVQSPVETFKSVKFADSNELMIR